MRKKIVAGNWKMNNTFDEAIDLAKAVNEQVGVDEKGLIIMAPPALYLKTLVDITKDNEGIEIASQNSYLKEKGAYTGEISPEMLASIGVKYAIIGHSERREYFNESDEVLKIKVTKALEAGLNPIFCCGEPLNVREADTHVDYVKKQLSNSIFDLSPEDFSKLVIAYEPIWAIGTGVTASSDQAQDMHKEIRAMIAKVYGAEMADNTTILYGGSCKPENAKELFSQADVDGGLIGGASLKADDFIAILRSY